MTHGGEEGRIDTRLNKYFKVVDFALARVEKNGNEEENLAYVATSH